MKNLLLFIAVLTLAFACTKPIDTEDLPKVDPTLITKAPSKPSIKTDGFHVSRTYYLKNIKTSKGLMDSVVVADTLPVVDSIVVPVEKIPSISINDTIQSVKFRCFYSDDQAQSNVYEIEIYSNGENIALNKPVIASSTNYIVGVSQIDDNDGEISHINDGNILSRWSSDRKIDIDNDNPIYDSLHVNYATKAHIVINFGQKYKVDSIRLFLYGDTLNWKSHKQTFGLYVSKDFIKWDSIGGGVKVNQLTF